MSEIVFNWIKETEQKPEFGKPVLVCCRIFGRDIYTYERLDPDYDWGNWHDGKNLGVLPPVWWSYIPEPPIEPIDYDNLPF